MELEQSGGGAKARSTHGAKGPGHARAVPAAEGASGQLQMIRRTAAANCKPIKSASHPTQHAGMELERCPGGAKAHSTHEPRGSGRARAIPAAPEGA